MAYVIGAIAFVALCIYGGTNACDNTPSVGSDKEACAEHHDLTEGQSWDANYSTSTYMGTEGGKRITIVTLGTRYNDSVATCSVAETEDSYQVR